jgi:hypothetical protein
MSRFDRNSDHAGRAAKLRPAQKRSGGGTLLGVFIGLVIGISIAFGVVWYLNKATLPFQNKYEGAPKDDKNKPAAPGGGATAPALPGASSSTTCSKASNPPRRARPRQEAPRRGWRRPGQRRRQVVSSHRRPRPSRDR